MKRLAVCLLLLIPSALQAQSAIPSSRLAWDQAAPDLASANGYTYKLYADGSSTGTVLSGVTCTGSSSPFVCVVSFPAFTPGNHTASLSATNLAGESVKSAPFAFVFVVVPAAPANLRVQ